MDQIADRLIDLLSSKGRRQYGGERVSQCEHALQCAMQAEAAGASAPVVAAALLHDLGHLLYEETPQPALYGIDDKHEEIGAARLLAIFGPAVAEPVRLHVAAKRYLCATDPGYFALLSPGSVRSLALQGGPFAPAEAAAFRALPFAEEAIQIRRRDEAAKTPGIKAPTLDHFRAVLQVAS